jgi:hypothetical protein
MNQDKIKALAMELYKNEEVAIELANVIFGIRDGDYDEPDKFEFKFTENETFLIGETCVHERCKGKDTLSVDIGRYRTTKEGAELSLKRNQRANRLEMLVEYLGGLKEFVYGKKNWYVGFYDKEYEWGSYSTNTLYAPERVYMTEEVAIKVCELLNSGAYSLDG